MTILGASVSPDGVGAGTRAEGAGGVGAVATAGGGVPSIDAASNAIHPTPPSSALTSWRAAGAYHVENCQTDVASPARPICKTATSMRQAMKRPAGTVISSGG